MVVDIVLAETVLDAELTPVSFADSTLLSVPGGMSIPGLPATVTVPGLRGCQN